MICLTWTTVGLSLLWGGIISGLVFGPRKMNEASDHTNTTSWHIIPSSTTPYLNMGWDLDDDVTVLPAAMFCGAFAFISGLQWVLTLCLHCSELQINCVRDEALWRRASSSAGLTRQSPNSLTSFVTSWHAMTFFALKALIHWLFGLAMTIDLSTGINMRPFQILYFCIGVIALAVYTTSFSLWRPRGMQPGTFGHLQTLADLMDCWPAEDERIYRGDKTDKETCVEAGISSEPLPVVQKNGKYM